VVAPCRSTSRPPAPESSQSCTLGGQLAGNTVGNFFATQLSATGGTAPYTWSGQAPAGLTIQPDGIIVVTPTHTGTTTFTVTVTDASGLRRSRSLSPIRFPARPEWGT
jgi:hypothetical protein